MNTTELLAQRESTHGNFHQGALIFNDITKHIQNAPHLDSSHKYALTMIATKITRILQGNPHEVDHWQDICGYATLGGRLNLTAEEPTATPLNDMIEVPVVHIHKG